MSFRKPVLVSGNPSYSGGDPVYDSGQSLGSRAIRDAALWWGEHLVAKRFLEGKRTLAVRADSQFSAGPARAVSAIEATWPIEWSALPVQHTGNSSAFYMSNLSNSADEFIDGGWPQNTLSANAVERDTILANAGITPEDIPARFVWKDNVGTATQFISQYQLNANTDGSDLYSFRRFQPEAGVLIRFRLAMIAGGVGSFDAFDFEIGTIDDANQTSTGSTSSAGTLSGVAGEDAVAISGGKSLVAIRTAAQTSFKNASGSAFWPYGRLNEDGEDFANKEGFFFQGLVERMADANTPEVGPKLSAVCDAAGRNPECFIGGGTPTNGAWTNHGTTRAIRQWYWKAYGVPDTLLYSFGHNPSVRSVSSGVSAVFAQSIWQADLFDLIYQDCEDIKDLTGSYPDVMVIAPWAASNMDSARQTEAAGVVQAINRIGIPALLLSLFNRFAGDTTNYDADGVHPDGSTEANALYLALYQIMEQAAAYKPSGGVGRRRRRARR